MTKYEKLINISDKCSEYAITRLDYICKKLCKLSEEFKKEAMNLTLAEASEEI